VGVLMFKVFASSRDQKQESVSLVWVLSPHRHGFEICPETHMSPEKSQTESHKCSGDTCF